MNTLEPWAENIWPKCAELVPDGWNAEDYHDERYHPDPERYPDNATKLDLQAQVGVAAVWLVDRGWCYDCTGIDGHRWVTSQKRPDSNTGMLIDWESVECTDEDALAAAYKACCAELGVETLP